MRCTPLALLLISSAAQAGDRSTAPVSFHGSTDLFRGSQLSDFFPADASLSIRFAADLDSHLDVSTSGEAHLTWPEAKLNQAWQDVKGPGAVTLTTHVDLSADVAVDLWGFNFTYNMWNQSFDWVGTNQHDTLLLPGNGANAVTAEVNRIEYGALTSVYQVNSFVTLHLAGDIAPNNTATVSGQKIRTNRRDVADLSQAATLDPPELNQGTLDLESQWYGNVVASFAMDITPTISLCSDFIGCYDVPYTYHWKIADDTRAIKSNPEAFTLAIPAVVVDANELRFGDVDMGRSSSMTIHVGSRSQATLTGQVVSDHPGVTVTPSTFSLETGEQQAITVTFAPQVDGEMRGSVIVQSDDPTQPELAVDVFGAGHAVIDPGTDPIDTQDTSDTGVIDEPGGCGCQSSGAPMGVGAAALALALSLLRRRR